MNDAILTDNDRKAQLSFAYLSALAAKAGYTCQPGPQPDVDSIDATVRCGDRLRTQFDVQLKATSTPDKKEDGLHFRLPRKNYNDLTAARMSPLILVVLGASVGRSRVAGVQRRTAHDASVRLVGSAAGVRAHGGRLEDNRHSDRATDRPVRDHAADGPVEGALTMNIDATDIALAESVTPRGVHAYLAANGWMKLGAYHGNTGDVYCLREDEQESVLVPASTKFADYVTRLVQLAETLGRVENRRHSTVLSDLSLAEVDLIRVRFPKAYDDSSIPLSAGVGLLDESRKLLLAAACSASRPQRLFRAGRNQKAAAYVEHVRLGQTEPGSFVANLLAPVTPSLTRSESTQLPLLEPFERRVAQMLVSGLRASREATELVNRGEDIDAFEERIGKGVSANLCQATASLINTGEGLDVSVSWALTRQPQDDEADERAVVAFTPSDAPVLEEAARILSDRQERVDERIDGYVSALTREQSEPDGTVTIKAVIDGALASVKADFSPLEYTRITDAHNRRLSVSLEGDLRREGQRWRLMNPRDLTVIEDED